jgi:hypothetical protein
MDIQTWYDFLMAMQPPYLDPQTAPAADSGCITNVRGEFIDAVHTGSCAHFDKEDPGAKQLVSGKQSSAVWRLPPCEQSKSLMSNTVPTRNSVNAIRRFCLAFATRPNIVG